MTLLVYMALIAVGFKAGNIATVMSLQNSIKNANEGPSSQIGFDITSGDDSSPQ